MPQTVQEVFCGQLKHYSGTDYNTSHSFFSMYLIFHRFKDASENFTGTPTPLLLFAEAFMYSSSAQSHIADEEISYECVR